jgi:DNA-binding NarL/FixJ family response regulator
MKKPPSAMISVAIVEDDARVRHSLLSILGQARGVCCVGAYPNGEEAVEGLPALRPEVVFMDINLPAMDGVECVRRLVERIPEARILMLTVHEDSDAIFNSLAAGAKGYLLKPPRAADLIAAVHDVFAGGAPMTSVIARKVVQSFKAAGPSPREAENLSPREVEVLELLVRGLAYKEIAADLGISYSTVHTHIQRIYDKLHVQSRSHAVAKYLRVEF